MNGTKEMASPCLIHLQVISLGAKGQRCLTAARNQSDEQNQRDDPPPSEIHLHVISLGACGGRVVHRAPPPTGR